MNHYLSFYEHLSSEINDNSIPQDQIPEFLSRKFDFEYNEILLKLDTTVLSTFSEFDHIQNEIEKEFVNSIEEYYKVKLNETKGPIYDGSTEVPIENLADVKKEVNNYKIWREYYNNNREKFSIQEINVDRIKKVHRYLLRENLPGECGDFRGIQTGISGSEITPSLPFEIEDHLIAAIEKLQNSNDHPVTSIVKFHHRFLVIHPFSNGNGRVIREIINNWLIDIGLPFAVLPNSNEINYRNYLHKADNNEFEELIDYFCYRLIDKIKQ